jgi:hypothetical protein
MEVHHQSLTIPVPPCDATLPSCIADCSHNTNTLRPLVSAVPPPGANETAPSGFLSGRASLRERLASSVASEGEGLLLFTHIRRTAGTALEESLLLPAFGRGNSLECMEGGHARFGEMTARQRDALAGAMEGKRLQYRHCPYGMQALVAPRPWAYITMLRDPYRRLKVSQSRTSITQDGR